jgi:hypothetical protein
MTRCVRSYVHLYAPDMCAARASQMRLAAGECGTARGARRTRRVRAGPQRASRARRRAGGARLRAGVGRRGARARVPDVRAGGRAQRGRRPEAAGVAQPGAPLGPGRSAWPRRGGRRRAVARSAASSLHRLPAGSARQEAGLAHGRHGYARGKGPLHAGADWQVLTLHWEHRLCVSLFDILGPCCIAIAQLSWSVS